MFKDLFEFFESVFLRWSGPQIAALIVGMLLGALGLALFGRWLGFLLFPAAVRRTERERDRLDAENHDLREKLAAESANHRTVLGLLDQSRKERDREQAESQLRIHQLSEECARQKEDAVSSKERLTLVTSSGRKYYLKCKELQQEVTLLTDQVQSIMAMEGRFWEAPCTSTTPGFRPRDDKAAPIIAVLNLKGGVGKTTLTANLGARLWHDGLRVLQVDLDHQGTLTSLCLSQTQERDAFRGEGRLVSNVLKAPRQLDQAILDNLMPLPHAKADAVSAYVLPANKTLAAVEEDLKARWLLNKAERDSRFILREALHAPLVQEAFDMVLLDCPPRITTSCINALASADFVLIPVLLDKPSTDAVPHLLGWLRHLKECGICPRLTVLGIVANRTHYANRLTAREKHLWANLPPLCKDAWKEPIYFFERNVPQKPLFAEAAHRRTFAAFEPKLEPIFADLVREVIQRKVFHEDHRFAVVPS